jgi:hypothetical protein
MADRMPEAALAAQQLLGEYGDKYGLDEMPPVPVEAIAESLLLLNITETGDLRSVEGAPEESGRLSGLLTGADQTIWIDAREAERSEGRRRFTIAHEIGHWILHAKRGQDANFEHSCRPTDIREKKADGEGVEAEANRFAAELLMPEEIITQVAEECAHNLPLLAERFGVSVPAVELRLRVLGALPAWMRG